MLFYNILTFRTSSNLHVLIARIFTVFSECVSMWESKIFGSIQKYVRKPISRDYPAILRN